VLARARSRSTVALVLQLRIEDLMQSMKENATAYLGEKQIREENG
jgi:hypothetical protein